MAPSIGSAWILNYRPGRTRITLLSNMSPVSASFIIQHITYQIFLLLLALWPCCQPSVSGKKGTKLVLSRLSCRSLLSFPLSYSLRHLLSFCAFPPWSGADVLRTHSSFRFYWGFLPSFPLEWKHCMKQYKSSCVGDTQRRHDRTTSLPLYSTKLSTHTRFVALCHIPRLWSMCNK